MFNFHNKSHLLTREQIPIVSHEKGNLIVEAGAGCGKTSTLREFALAKKGKRILACAYNKRIQESLTLKMPGNTTCSTLHSMAFQNSRSLGKATVSSTLERDYLRGANPGLEYEQIASMTRQLQTFLASAPQALDEFNDVWVGRMLAPFFSFENYLFMKDELSKEKDTSFSLMIASFVEAKALKMNKPDIILVDEAQDLDQGLLNMLFRVKKEFDKVSFIFCGDPLQSIYGFKGALPGVMQTIRRGFSCTQLPLQTCFRCPENIISAMKARFPRSKLIPFKKGGVVNSIDGNDLVRFIREGEKCYLARTNAQLMRVSLTLIKASVPHSFAASDVGQKMLKIVSNPKFSLSQCALRATLFFEKNEDDLVDERFDTELALAVLATRCANTSELVQQIRLLFLQPKSKDSLLLSTAHGSKGLEWDTVFVEMHQLGRARKNASTNEKVQEENLLYVAFTRAKENLFMVR